MPNIPVFELKANEDLNRCEQEMRRVLILGKFYEKMRLLSTHSKSWVGIYVYKNAHIKPIVRYI